MELNHQQLVEQLLAPLTAQFSLPRPDGSIILSLLDESQTTVYSRVFSKAQTQERDSFLQCLEDIRLELAVRSGNIPADLRKTLKEQDSVLNYCVN